VHVQGDKPPTDIHMIMSQDLSRFRREHLGTDRKCGSEVDPGEELHCAGHVAAANAEVHNVIDHEAGHLVLLEVAPDKIWEDNWEEVRELPANYLGDRGRQPLTTPAWPLLVALHLTSMAAEAGSPLPDLQRVLLRVACQGAFAPFLRRPHGIKAFEGVPLTGMGCNRIRRDDVEQGPATGTR